jgi:16S rRNA (uracil1498-N3)-methyltransferase
VRAVRVPISKLSPGERRLEPESAHYLARVHRLRAGDTFVAFDPDARLEAPGEIVRVDHEAVSVRLGETTNARAVPLLEVTLIQCAGKGDKIDDVVRSTTALGVHAVIVAESARSVARLDPARGEKRRERWGAIALDAARQSGRGDTPAVEGPRRLDDLLATLAADPATKICMDPLALTSFTDAVRGGAPSRTFVLLVGPEGGLTDEELALAERTGFTRARLGPFVLRTELAATAALGALVAISESER